MIYFSFFTFNFKQFKLSRFFSWLQRSFFPVRFFFGLYWKDTFDDFGTSCIRDGNSRSSTSIEQQCASVYADRISPRFLKNYIRPNFPELLSSSLSVYSLYLRGPDGVFLWAKRFASFRDSRRSPPSVLSSSSSPSPLSILFGPKMCRTVKRLSYVNDFPDARMG